MSKLTTITEPPFSALAALGITFSPVGLALPEGLPVESWLQLMTFLPRMSDAIKWGLGDALNYGEARYGSKYTAAMDATGIPVERLRNYAWLSRKVELSLRNDNLSWSHHMEVADLPPAEQREWLAYAVEQGLTTRALRQAIDAAQEEEKALEATKARRVTFERVVPAEMPLSDPEPEFAPPIGKKDEPKAVQTFFDGPRGGTPSSGGGRSDLTLSSPVRPNSPPRVDSAIPAPSTPRTEMNWRRIERAVYNFTAGTKSLTYIFEIIEVRTEGGFAYDITNNGNTLGRRSSVAGAKQRCEEFMAETLKKAEGK